MRKIVFFTGLALIICGNGFFKPNISTIVGSLYPPGSPRRDGGFTIFYMGVNLGAGAGAAAVRLYRRDVRLALGVRPGGDRDACRHGRVRGPHAIVADPDHVGALGAAVGLFCFHPDNPFSIGVNVLVGIALLVASGVVAWLALERGGIPAEAGAPPDRARLRRRVFGPFPRSGPVYLGRRGRRSPSFVLLVSGFAPFTAGNRPMSLIADETLKAMETSEQPPCAGVRRWWSRKSAGRPA